MGKAERRKRNRQSRLSMDPISKPLSRSKHANGIDTVKQEENVLPVIKKLSSPDAIEREWASVALSHLVTENPGTRRLLQGKNIVGLLIERMSDSADDVVVESVGALRNLAIEGGYDLCAEMYNKGILSSMKTLIPRVSTSLTAILSNTQPALQGRIKQGKLVWDLADNLLSIIWSMAETSEKILSSLNDLDLLPWISAFILNFEKIPLKIVITAAQALYVFTDDNPNGCKSMAELDINNLRKILHRKSNDVSITLVKALVGGAILNMRPSQQVIADLTPFLCDVVINADLSSLVSEVAEALKRTQDDIIAREKHQKVESLTKNAMREQDDILGSVRRKITLLHLAFEILTIISVHDGTDVADDGWIDDTNDEEMEEIEQDLENITGDDDKEDQDDDKEGQNFANGKDVAMETRIDQDIVPLPSSFSYLISHLFPKLLSFVEPQTHSFPPPPNTVAAASDTVVEGVSRMLTSTHLKATELVNNILVSASSSSEGKQWLEQQNENVDLTNIDFNNQHNLIAVLWNTLWTVLQTVIESSKTWHERNPNLSQYSIDDETELRKREITECIISCFWALARGIVDGPQMAEGIRVANYTEVSKLVHDIYSSSTSSIGCKVKCVGLLGCLARRRNGAPSSAIELNMTIGKFMLKIISQANRETAEIVIEALNAIYDIYGDISYEYDDPVFRKQGFLKHLEASRGIVRSMTKSIDRRREPDLRLRADEAWENLVAFIKYKQKEAKIM